jgi:hypothetical protein
MSAVARGGHDPQLVVDEPVELAEAEPGNRPLRRPVGEDVTPVCTEINETQAKAQKAILSPFGSGFARGQ